MSDKYPGFFTAIFGGRKVKEPEPVKPKKPEKKAEKKPEPPQELPKEPPSEEPSYMRHMYYEMKKEGDQENE